MNETYQLAKQYYIELRNERHQLCDYSCCNLAVEKYLGMLWMRFYKLIYRKELDIENILYFYPPKQDFFDGWDKDQTFPLLSEGEYHVREEMDYGESLVCILLKTLFNDLTTWKFDYFIANTNEIYGRHRIEIDSNGRKIVVCDETVYNYDDIDLTERIFKLRSIKELISDSYIENDFFDEKDLAHIDMVRMEFERKFRDLFNPCSYDYSAKYILLKSLLIPDFLKLKEELLEQKERQLYIFIKSVISSLTEAYNYNECVYFISPNLSAAYFIYNMSIDYCDIGCDELGITELYPDFFLAPYLIDEGIRMLDKKYHFIGGINDGQ